MISSELYNYVLKNIPYGSTILELGSGNGTELLSKYYTMYSIEHDNSWVDKFTSNYIYAPLVNNLWYDVEIIKEKIPKHYDLLLVDGPPKSFRRKLFWENRYLFDLSKTIILDDTVRKDELNMALKFKTIGYRVQFISAQNGKKGFAVITNP